MMRNHLRACTSVVCFRVIVCTRSFLWGIFLNTIIITDFGRIVNAARESAQGNSIYFLGDTDLGELFEKSSL